MSNKEVLSLNKEGDKRVILNSIVMIGWGVVGRWLYEVFDLFLFLYKVISV